MATAKGTA